LIERCPDLIHDPTQIATTPRLRAQLPDLLGKPVQATTVDTAAHQISQRIPERPSRKHVLTDPVDGLAYVERRLERIRAATPGSVAETVMGPVRSLTVWVIAIAVTGNHDYSCQAAP
jgi:hypothetical protein